MKINNALKEGCNILNSKNITSANLDSEILLSEALSIDRNNLILNLDKNIKKEEYLNYKFLINQRFLLKPIAYLIKKKEFWKSCFFVDKNVLIPRPDTETIVENALEIMRHKSVNSILEIGVGSGCIILSILGMKKRLKAVGIDISQKALDVCKINSKNLKIYNRIKLFKSDIDKFNYGKYDMIISNPPYINKFDLGRLKKEVLNYEPNSALYGGIDGTVELKKVIIKSSKLIKRKGILILEIAYNQRRIIEEMLKEYKFYIKNVVKDLANNNRCIISIKI